MSWLLPFSEVVRNLGLVIAAGIGIYLAWRRVSAATFELLSTYLKESAARYGDHEPPVDVREIMNIIKDYVVQG
ncbi:MAG TPA: hypothetical protein VEM36_03800 [Xanthobacteraceae bacterium]|nr:hypothetical protein [Xanthobacteraceae bacterium]